MTLAPALAHRVAQKLRELDTADRWPLVACFEVRDDVELLARVEPAPLSPSALVRVLVERVRDGRLTREDALTRVTLDALAATTSRALVAPTAAPPIARGLAASPGVAAGRLATPEDFARACADPRVVIVDDAAPEDAMAIRACVAIIATSGGLTADAAIAARALRKPCVVSTPLRPGDRDHPARGDWITVDGTSGAVYIGVLDTHWAPATTFAAELIAWLAPRDGEAPGDALLRAQRAIGQAAGT